VSSRQPVRAQHQALVAIVAVLGVTVASCNSGDYSTSESDEPSASASQPSPETSADVEESSSPSTIGVDECRSTPFFEGDDDPDSTAQLTHEAWELGDEACAEFLMTRPAREELFAQDGSDNPYEFALCRASDVGAVDQHCGFFTEGAELRLLMHHSEDNGWQVVDVEFLDA
jgi:hypothetical protein